MATDDNPYAAPRAREVAIGVRSGKREDLRSVALYQKGLLTCILCYVVGAVGLSAGSEAGMPLPAVIVLAVMIVAAVITGLVFTVLLAMKVYNGAIGIILGICVLLPCVGGLVLLAVSMRATSILRQNGIPVGLMGADLSRI